MFPIRCPQPFQLGRRPGVTMATQRSLWRRGDGRLFGSPAPPVTFRPHTVAFLSSGCPFLHPFIPPSIYLYIYSSFYPPFTFSIFTITTYTNNKHKQVNKSYPRLRVFRAKQYSNAYKQLSWVSHDSHSTHVRGKKGYVKSLQYKMDNYTVSRSAGALRKDEK